MEVGQQSGREEVAPEHSLEKQTLSVHSNGKSVFFSACSEDPRAEWMSAVLTAAGGGDLPCSPELHGKLVELSRSVARHRAFFDAFPHLKEPSESRAERCRTNVRERWRGPDDEATLEKMVTFLTNAYKHYGFPETVDEQMVALSLHGGGEAAEVHCREGMDLPGALKVLEYSLLADARIIEVHYL